MGKHYLLNLINFLGLRVDHHAQYEIRNNYADGHVKLH